MSTKAFLVVLAIAGLLLAAVVYLHMPPSGHRRASALHGGQ